MSTNTADMSPCSFRSYSASRELQYCGTSPQRKRQSRKRKCSPSPTRCRSVSPCSVRSEQKKELVCPKSVLPRVSSWLPPVYMPKSVPCPPPACEACGKPYPKQFSPAKSSKPCKPCPQCPPCPPICSPRPPVCSSCPPGCKKPKSKSTCRTFSPKLAKRRGRSTCRLDCMGPCCFPVPMCSPCLPVDKCQQMRIDELLERYKCDDISPCCPKRETSMTSRLSCSVPRRNSSCYTSHRKRFSSRSPLGCRYQPTCLLNFTQSSNARKQQNKDDAICSQCQNVISFSKAPSEKVCRCVFALGPHCIRRTGPRSTVREYLSTLDKPKPKFRQFQLGSGCTALPSASAISPQVKDSRTSTASSKTSKGQGRKRAKSNGSVVASLPPGTPPVSEAETAAAAPGVIPIPPAGATQEAQPTATGGDEQVMKAEVKTSDDNNNNEIEESQPAATTTENRLPNTMDLSKSKVMDDNNNSPAPAQSSTSRYGEPMNVIPTRYSSVPNQSFVPSTLDTGYTRRMPSPYISSSGLSMSSYGSGYPYVHGSESTMGYVHSAQDYRRNIRDYYEIKAKLSNTSHNRYRQDLNLNAWHTMTSYDRPTQQYTSVFPIYSSLREQSAKLNESKPRVPNFVEENMQTLAKARSPQHKVKQRDVIVLKGPPKGKSKTPLYSPRKSLVDDKKAVETMFQRNWESKLPHTESNVSPQKPLLHGPPEQQGGFSKPVKQLSPKLNSEIKGITQNLLVGGLSGKQNTVGQLGHDLNQETPCIGTDLDTDASVCTQNQLSIKQLSECAPTDSMMLGKESSVDHEELNQELLGGQLCSNTVRKIEPTGTLFLSTAHVNVEAEETPILTKEDEAPEASAASTAPQEVSCYESAVSDIQPVPVFQGLMDRFGESVQILVRTKEMAQDKIRLLSNGEQPELAGGTTSRNYGESDVDKVEEVCVAAAGAELGCGAPENTEHVGSDKENKPTIHILANSKATAKPLMRLELSAIPQSHVTLDEGSSDVDGVVQNCALPSNNVPGETVQLDSEPQHEVSQDTKQRSKLLAPFGAKTMEKLSVDNPSMLQKQEPVAPEAVHEEKNTSFAHEGERETSVDPELETPIKPEERLQEKIERNKTEETTTPQVTPDDHLGQGETTTNNKHTVETPCVTTHETDTCEVKSKRSFFWLFGKAEESIGSSVDPTPSAQAPAATQSILDALKSKQSIFQKVNDSPSATVMIAAKSKFPNSMVKVEHMINASNSTLQNGQEEETAPQNGKQTAPINTSTKSMFGDIDGGPFAGMMKQSARPSTPNLTQGQRTPIRIGSLTEAMKQFVLTNGTPV